MKYDHMNLYTLYSSFFNDTKLYRYYLVVEDEGRMLMASLRKNLEKSLIRITINPEWLYFTI